MPDLQERFGPAAAELLRRAYADEHLKMKLTKEQRILLLLADGGWHTAREMSLKVSHRFGGYLHSLKEQGVIWEKRLDPERPVGEAHYQYRLTAPGAPPTLF